MIPIVTPVEMTEIDRVSPFAEAELIERAGFAVAKEALRSLGGGYGRRVGLIVGKGNNGKDGLVAARLLRKRGVKCQVVDPSDVADLGNVDLVIDAAYGTGFRGAWSLPEQPTAPVVAVDIPSGVNALTGMDNGSLQAEKTVTFAALKPGLLLDAGPQKAGSVVVADIGLEINDATSHLFEDSDWLVARKVRTKTDHKWTNAVRILAGSPGMQGACGLAAQAALRAGAGMVVASTPGGETSDTSHITEVVTKPLLNENWAREILSDSHRYSSLLIGPGLGLGEVMKHQILEAIENWPGPVVVDADAITALAGDLSCLKKRAGSTILTPHDAEFDRLTNSAARTDRFQAVRNLARNLNAVVLLKGPTTLISDPSGNLVAVNSGNQNLATAGTGDVLAGMICALYDEENPVTSVAAAAHWHGLTGAMAHEGLLASDLPDLLMISHKMMQPK
jgi:NAD(P)H-hydrate epimerase|tara:strand:- start:415 stop:1761 length:1347 start_codon:yes stop_codon:yes gene_type:complete